MKTKLKNLILLLFLLLFSANLYSQAIIADHTKAKLDPIPASAIELAKANLHIAYDHTSHGSQITDAMAGLRDLTLTNLVGYKGDIYDWNNGGSGNAMDLHDNFTSVGDLGYEDSWAPATRTYLDNPANAEVNVVMWSWCDIYGHDIAAYLTNMETLISEYGPGGTKILDGTRTIPVTFVFMTGHTNTGIPKNQWTFNANKQIRQHCIDYNRVLFDFYDIECYNPDGEYFGDGEPNLENYGTYNGLKNLGDDCSYNLDGGGRGNWASEWRNSHTQNVDWYSCNAEHSDALNGNLKAYAAWWLWARLAGWNEGPSVTISTATPLTETNLDDGVLTVKLTEETFADNTLSPTNFQLNNKPDGTTIESVQYTNDHQATINLAFDGTDFDDIANFNITVLASELSGNDNLTSNNLPIEANNEGVPSVEISSSVQLSETNLDDATIVVELTNETFVDNSLSASNFQLNNATAGTTIESIQYTNSTRATIDLAFNGTDFDDDITNFSITVLASELSGNDDLTSNNLSIEADLESSISSIKDNETFKVYPNPINQFVTIEYNSTSENYLKLELVDLTGKKIMEKEYSGGNLIREETLNVSDLRKGNYYIVVNQGNKRSTVPVIKE